MARVCIGCGLKTDDTGALVVDTGAATWPFTCADTQGGSLYCSSDNRLILPPGIEVSTDQESHNEIFPSNTKFFANDGDIHDVGTTTLVSSAPGTCGQQVLRFIEVEFQADVVMEANGDVRWFIQNDQMGQMFNDNNATSSRVQSTVQTTKVLFDLRTAGQASGQFTFQLQSIPQASSFIEIRRLQWFYRMAYVTSHTP